MHPAVNAGVAEAHARGVLTSASLMVRPPAAEDAAALARRHPALSVGLHIDLGEWVYGAGGWEEAYRVVDLDDPGAVEEEVRRQLERFRLLLGRDPTHLDSHQHVHRSPPVDRVAAALAAELGVPLRGVGPVRHVGDFYGQDGRGRRHHEGIGVEGLVRLLHGLPPGDTELGCHPASAPIPSVYGTERVTELRTLCDPAVRASIDRGGIELVSFHAITV